MLLLLLFLTTCTQLTGLRLHPRHWFRPMGALSSLCLSIPSLNSTIGHGEVGLGLDIRRTLQRLTNTTTTKTDEEEVEEEEEEDGGGGGGWGVLYNRQGDAGCVD
eukprot:CAMPEP_0173191936 /NCGR_PEP_ID=MMETSP1141-20130122/13155_1 /TAXON_ID=483371 /ORGANISM="non described non described, Strain CCMP2298" /LENGTH=104 /DNA_ID=CAMNT_0014116167 /DNA_START=353 /DNA_END=667 /DNA_ORIENTATION=-